MRSISEAAARITGQSFSRKYIALGRVVNSWPEIVGAEFAKKAQPVKIHYRKRERSNDPVVTLDIAANSSDSTILHYQKDLILERINQIFGRGWITAIRFVPVAKHANLPLKKQKFPLTEPEKNNLSLMLEQITDSAVKDYLQNLGAAIITESKA